MIRFNKTALITGGSRGIGKATALRLQDEYNIVVAYNNSYEQAKLLISQLKSAIAVKADISNSEQVKSLVEQAELAFDTVDLLVNNAGIAEQKLFSDITEQDWDRMFDVNVKSMFYMCKAILPKMIQRQSGSIINIASMWGQVGASCEVHYSASKAAVIGFTKALAKEVGLSGITVNCVSPGVIATDMNSSLSNDTLAYLKEETPLNKIGKPEDIAEMIAFLASDKAGFITGQVIGVNGGYII